MTARRTLAVLCLALSACTQGGEVTRYRGDQRQPLLAQAPDGGTAGPTSPYLCLEAYGHLGTPSLAQPPLQSASVRVRTLDGEHTAAASLGLGHADAGVPSVALCVPDETGEGAAIDLEVSSGRRGSEEVGRGATRAGLGLLQAVVPAAGLAVDGIGKTLDAIPVTVDPGRSLELVVGSPERCALAPCTASLAPRGEDPATLLVAGRGVRLHEGRPVDGDGSPAAGLVLHLSRRSSAPPAAVPADCLQAPAGCGRAGPALTLADGARLKGLLDAVQLDAAGVPLEARLAALRAALEAGCPALPARLCAQARARAEALGAELEGAQVLAALGAPMPACAVAARWAPAAGDGARRRVAAHPGVPVLQEQLRRIAQAQAAVQARCFLDRVAEAGTPTRAWTARMADFTAGPAPAASWVLGWDPGACAADGSLKEEALPRFRRAVARAAEGAADVPAVAAALRSVGGERQEEVAADWCRAVASFGEYVKVPARADLAVELAGLGRLPPTPERDRLLDAGARLLERVPFLAPDATGRPGLVNGAFERQVFELQAAVANLRRYADQAAAQAVAAAPLPVSAAR